MEVPSIMFNVHNRTVTAHTSQDRLNIVVVVTGGDELDRISCGLGSLESESGDNFDGRRSETFNFKLVKYLSNKTNKV